MWWSYVRYEQYPCLSPPCKSLSFFTIKAKVQKCWRYIVCKYLDFREKDGSIDSSILALFIIANGKCRFIWFIFHQNVGGLRSKIDELVNCFGIDGINPNVLCFSDHHMEYQDLLHVTLLGYILGSSFCNQHVQEWGVCIFVSKLLISTKLLSDLTVKNRIWKFVPLD